MRVAVLSRLDATEVFTAGMARGAWATSAANLLLTVPILVAYAAQHPLGSALELSLAIIVLLLGLALVGAFRPTWWMAAGFLVVGFVATAIFEVALVTADPTIGDNNYFLVNRIAMSLVMVGVAARNWRGGLIWPTIGWFLSIAASAVVAGITATPLRTGWGPLLALGLFTVANIVHAGIQSARRPGIPDLGPLEDETRRLSVEEGARARVAAAVHDTLLNDLSIVMTAPAQLDKRTVARLRSDLTTLNSGGWRAEADSSFDTSGSESQDLLHRIRALVTEVDWRGLTVTLTGAAPGSRNLDPDSTAALVDAVRACLENVLRHSGTTAAQVEVTGAADAVTVIVSDHGAGFDPASVPADRLGLRSSVVDRIVSRGGSAKVWSSLGSGTSIVLRMPLRGAAPVTKVAAAGPSAVGEA